MRYENKTAAAIWLFGNFVDLVPIGPLDVAPPPYRHYCDDIDCLDCWNRGVKYADWKKERKLNGF